MNHRNSEPKFAICMHNDDYPASLELRKIYRVVPDEPAARHRLVRIVDESGEDYLYPQTYFVPVKLPMTVQKALLLPS